MSCLVLLSPFLMIPSCNINIAYLANNKSWDTNTLMVTKFLLKDHTRGIYLEKTLE